MTDTPPANEGDFRIGQYRVLRHIAQGGMGAVYRVEDTETGDHFAMKLAATHRNNPERFERIHRSLSNLEHPGILRSRRCGITPDGRSYMLFDYVGGTPAQVFAKSMGVPGTPARTTAVVTVGIHVADALHYLHCNEIIHRDVKSANVLVRENKSACLIDFDSAIMPDAPAADGRFVGTYTYAPPEQLKGTTVDARSDVYAMGVLMYRMLTGKRPFEGNSPEELIHKHFNETPPNMHQLVDGIPPQIVSIIESMLEKEPQNRPQSAEIVAQRLRQA